MTEEISLDRKGGLRIKEKKRKRQTAPATKMVETEPNQSCEAERNVSMTCVTYVKSCVPCGRMDFNSADFCSIKVQL